MDIDISAAIKELQAVKQAVPAMVIQAIETACFQVVQKARAKGLDYNGGRDQKTGRKIYYEDQTHRLRSSIGFGVYYNGELVASNFVNQGGEKGAEGVEIARQKVQEAAQEAGTNGIVAVVVAGADYATFVEAKGYDVLTGSALELEQLFRAELQNLSL